MSEICKNCKGEIEWNFCPNCGQKKLKRIDRTYIKDEIQYTVLHMNKGFLYSIKKILKAPGKTAREFVEGNRVNHYKPILLVFVVASISAFLTNTLIQPQELMASYNASKGLAPNQFMDSWTSLILNYQAILMLLSVPFMALLAWIAFKKWGYNYYENVILTAYCLVLLQVLTILIIIPIQFLLKDNITLFMIIPTSISFILMVGVFPWFYIDLYSEKSAGDVILRLLLYAFLLMVAYVLLVILCLILLFVYMNYYDIDPKILFGVKTTS